MPDDPTPPSRSFGVFLAELEDGRLHGALTDALRDLIGDLEEARQRGGKPKGKLTLTLNFTHDDGIVECSADFATKAPKPPRGRSIFWVTPDNNLTRRNPAQADLPFRDVSIPAGAARGLA